MVGGFPAEKMWQNLQPIEGTDALYTLYLLQLPLLSLSTPEQVDIATTRVERQK